MSFVSANGLSLHVETFGRTDDPPLLLIAGLGAQCINYPDPWCAQFADLGLFVVRFDNRDIGLSDRFDGEYTLADMADDAVGVLDALGLDSAHVWGSSMGGMIAQTMAIASPQRVRSLISVQSTPGDPSVGQSDPEALAAIISTFAPAADRSAAIDAAVELSRVLINNDDVFDRQLQVERAEAAYDRSSDRSGVARQAGAVIGATDRSAGLAALDVATLVIHGNRDPLIDISGGRRTAELVSNARFVEVDGMGHDLTPCFWKIFTDAVAEHLRTIEPALGSRA